MCKVFLKNSDGTVGKVVREVAVPKAYTGNVSVAAQEQAITRATHQMPRIARSGKGGTGFKFRCY